jgi:hypothetical protein
MKVLMHEGKLTHHGLRLIARAFGLTKEEQDEFESFLSTHQLDSARLLILQALDERVWKKKVGPTLARSLYTSLGYSPLELVIIRQTMYDPRIGIGHRIMRADG